MTPSALARNVDPSTGSAFRKHPGADGSEPSAPPIKGSHPYPKRLLREISKRSDPRMGEQTFHLTNIVRAEPNPPLFTVPADFRIVDGPQPIFYRTKQ